MDCEGRYQLVVAGISDSIGKNTENTVQLFPGSTLLRRRMVPSCLRKIFELTQSPNPVPTSRLVVKNGSKSFLLTSGAIPGPLSQTVRRTPALLRPLLY